MAIFTKIKFALRSFFRVDYVNQVGHVASPKSERKVMSLYTESMVSELMARASWSYDDAVAFAEKHSSVSVRSVISKIKSLKLDYTAKPKAATAKTDKVRKSEIVGEIALALGIQADAISGLAKADAACLRVLLAKVAG
jgi:predicted RNase H-related nuclease YkuK (DUF458 family)